MECWLATPLGPVAWRMEKGVLERVWLGRRLGKQQRLEDRGDAFIRWLKSYLAGAPLAPPPLAQAATPFQARVRAALLAIPFGETISYSELAKGLGSAPRAVGQALARNPLPLIVPCHRVVGAHGLGGFSAGIDWKRALLAFEQRMASAHDASSLRHSGGMR